MKTFQISQFFIVIFYYLEAEIDNLPLRLLQNVKYQDYKQKISDL